MDREEIKSMGRYLLFVVVAVALFWVLVYAVIFVSGVIDFLVFGPEASLTSFLLLLVLISTPVFVLTYGFLKKFLPSIIRWV